MSFSFHLEMLCNTADWVDLGCILSYSNLRSNFQFPIPQALKLELSPSWISLQTVRVIYFHVERKITFDQNLILRYTSQLPILHDTVKMFFLVQFVTKIDVDNGFYMRSKLILNFIKLTLELILLILLMFHTYSCVTLSYFSYYCEIVLTV